MIKVEHTKPYEIAAKFAKVGEKNGVDSEGYDVLVTDAELVLVEDGNGEYISRVQLGTGNGFCKPILISRTEKIEVGDSFYVSDLPHDPPSIFKAVKVEEGHSGVHGKVWILDKDYIVLGLCKKILALPEHFSPQQLQDIVDGKLKEGKCLVECEQIDVDEAYFEVSANKDFDKHHFHNYDSGGKTYKKEFEHLYRRIKLNPHITIYPVEEKVFDFNGIEDLRPYLLRHPDHEMVRSSCLHYLGDRFQEFAQIPVEEKMYTKKEIANYLEKFSEQAMTHGYSFNGRLFLTNWDQWFEQNVK